MAVRIAFQWTPFRAVFLWATTLAVLLDYGVALRAGGAGYSRYFDRTRVDVISLQAHQFASHNITVECWVYLSDPHQDDMALFSYSVYNPDGNVAAGVTGGKAYDADNEMLISVNPSSPGGQPLTRRFKSGVRQGTVNCEGNIACTELPSSEW